MREVRDRSRSFDGFHGVRHREKSACSLPSELVPVKLVGRGKLVALWPGRNVASFNNVAVAAVEEIG